MTLFHLSWIFRIQKMDLILKMDHFQVQERHFSWNYDHFWRFRQNSFLKEMVLFAVKIAYRFLAILRRIEIFTLRRWWNLDAFRKKRLQKDQFLPKPQGVQRLRSLFGLKKIRLLRFVQIGGFGQNSYWRTNSEFLCPGFPELLKYTLGILGDLEAFGSKIGRFLRFQKSAIFEILRTRSSAGPGQGGSRSFKGLLICPFR